MTSARICFSILMMTLILASCSEMTSTRMTESHPPQTQERPEEASVLAPAARDVDSKGGLTQQH